MSKVKLTDICNITTGKLDSNAAEENGKYPYFTCAPEPLYINEYAFDEDAILLAGNNASGNFHCQRFKGKFNAYQRTYVITSKEGYNIDYIYYNLKINLQYFKKISQGSQTKFLTMKILESFEVEDLNIENQNKLVKILLYLDRKIENNNKINAELEVMAKTIYDYWFLQFEFPNEEGKPYKSSGGKMVWNEELKREIPEGWEVGKINNILAKTESTKKYKVEEYKKSGKYPIIDQSINFICGYTNDECELIKLKNCIVFGDHTKYTKYINFDFAKGADGTQIINSKNENLPNYLLYRQILDMGLVSQGYSRYFKFLKDKDVIIPSNTISKIYMQTMKPILDKKKNIIFENQELASLRDFLLPLLMNGQVGFKEIALADSEI